MLDPLLDLLLAALAVAFWLVGYVLTAGMLVVLLALPLTVALRVLEPPLGLPHLSFWQVSALVGVLLMLVKLARLALARG